MKQTIKKGIIGLCLLLFSTISVFAQRGVEDIVTLKNGSIIRGQVLEYNREGKVKIQIKGGSILVYNSAEIIKIEKSDVQVENGKVERKLHVVKSKGIYNSLMFGTGICISCGQMGSLFIGEIDLDYTIGYRIHNSFGIGLGVGFLANAGNGMLPLYVNFRGNLLKDKSFNVYYNANIGYAFAIGSIGGGDVYGGLHVLGGFGLQFPSTRKGHTALDLNFFYRNDNYYFFDRPYFGPILRVGFVF